MALSRRKLKKKHINTFNHSVGPLASLIRGNNFEAQVLIECSKPRIRNKIHKYTDYNDITKFFGWWSVPNYVTSKVKRSRIKNIKVSFSMCNAEDIMSINGKPHTEESLMNLYLSKTNKE